MPRLIAAKGNGKCYSTADPVTVTPMPLDIVFVPPPPPPPGVPTPFVNTADLGSASGVASTVYVNDQEVVHKSSVIPTSSGAPANAIKGVKSPPPANNKCTFDGASGTVYACNQPVVRHRDLTQQNAGNCPGAVKLSQAFTLTGKGIVIDPKLTPAQQAAILAALEEMASTPRGKEFLEKMQNPAAMNGKTATITITNSGNACGYANSAARYGVPTAGGGLAAGAGTDAIVKFNPLKLAAGGDVRPPAVGLAHELVHAFQGANGTIPPGLAAGTATKAAELQAIGLDKYANDRFTDNAFREERGLKTRRSHNGKDAFGYNPSPGTVPPKGFRTGPSGKGLVYTS